MRDREPPPSFERIKRKPKLITYSARSCWSMCRRKKAYSSRALAREVMARAFAERGDGLRAYECPICGKWHITSRIDSRLLPR